MQVGLRVVRGPDWKWQNQDNGEGNVGTVVEIGRTGNCNTPDRTVVVQWDSGFRTNYRVGYQGTFDLRIYDSGPSGVRHQGIPCTECTISEIKGVRWKCAQCSAVDLCHVCYMNDKHDVNHAFSRIDGPSSGAGIRVPPRAKSLKIEARGIFSGARVCRGPDWDWGNQDGGPGKLGVVRELRGWDDESGRSVASVIWNTSSVINVYRLGHKGKVDLKYHEQPAAGGYYYRDHLAKLGETVEQAHGSSLSSQFKVGDLVLVDLEVEVLKVMQEGHGGWNPKMAEYVGQVGTVHRITDKGDMRIQYEGCSNRWTFHPGALTKVHVFSEGDRVRILENMTTVKELQTGHGEWTNSMKAILGKVGVIQKVYSDKDLRVKIGAEVWTLNPKCCTPLLAQNQGDINNTLTYKDRERDRDHHLAGSTSRQTAMDSLLSNDGPAATVTSSSCSAAEVSTEAAVGTAQQQQQQLSEDPSRLVKEAAQGHLDVVEAIIRKHPDKIDMKSAGKTALQVAAHQGHLEVVRFLIQSNSRLDSQDEEGDTPLHYSAFGNQPEVMSLLLSHGAKVNALNNGGCSTLHVAVNKQHTQCVSVIIAHSTCDVNLQDSYGDTSLHDAVSKDSGDILDLLLSSPSIDPSIKNQRGFNVLHHAALKGNARATEKILRTERGRQLVDVKKDDGFSALHLSSLNGHLEVTSTIISVGGGNIEICNNRHQTPLLLAVSQGHAAVIELLISKGANIRVMDEEGHDSLYLALHRESAPTGLDYAPTIQRILKEIEPELEVGSSEQGSIAPSLLPGSLALAGFLLLNGAQLRISPAITTSTAHLKILKRYATAKSSDPRSLVNLIECLVCSELEVGVTFHPCEHCIVCVLCSARMKKCLQCQTNIDRKVGPGGEEGVALDRLMDKCQMHERLKGVNIGGAGDTGGRGHTGAVDESRVCAICMENEWNVAFLCGHSVCSKCAEPLKVCHMCRKPIEGKINLFT